MTALLGLTGLVYNDEREAGERCKLAIIPKASMFLNDWLAYVFTAFSSLKYT